MADSVTSQTLIDGERTVIMKFTNISDGTGEITVIFSGRRNIPGIDHGGCIMIDGVPHQDGDRTVVLNPAYTLLA